jgi:hypothetical protein
MILDACHSRVVVRAATLVATLAAAVLIGGCAGTLARETASEPKAVEPRAGELTVLKAVRLDRALEDRILALDPNRVSERDVAETLAKAPAPKIILVHGGVYPVHLAMNSFGTFLVGMGYPEARIREPLGGEWSYSPYTRSHRLAGILVWHYEQDGMRPMVIGHSQGGLYAVKILKELAGQYDKTLQVWNPLTDQPEERTTLVDPYTGRERPAIGVSASYASVVGAGGWALVLPHQWDDFANLRRIPDTVEEFTGYFIDVDLFALSFPGNPFDVPYEANGRAAVRNVRLGALQNHVLIPVTHDLPANPNVRKWLDEYVPAPDVAAVAAPAEASSNAVWAADVWYSVKKHWVLEAQRLIRARRAAFPG